MRRKIRSKKDQARKRRHMSIRNRVVGTAERPRVCVFRSNSHIYAQLIDDVEGRTLATVSSLKAPAAKAQAEVSEQEGEKKKKKGKKKEAPAGAKVLAAREVGRMLAEVAKEKGIIKVAFDRGGYLYHGRVRALAEGARSAGLDF